MFAYIDHVYSCEEEKEYIFCPMWSLEHHPTSQTKLAKHHRLSCEEPTIDPPRLSSHPRWCKDAFSTRGNSLSNLSNKNMMGEIYILIIDTMWMGKASIGSNQNLIIGGT